MKSPRDTHLMDRPEELLQSTKLCKRVDMGSVEPEDTQAVEVTEVDWGSEL